MTSSPAVRLLAAAVRLPGAYNGHPLNRRLYLPDTASTPDPSFGGDGSPLVMAALMVTTAGISLPEELPPPLGQSHQLTGNAAFAAAAAGCCGYPCWQAWMDLTDRAQIPR